MNKVLNVFCLPYAGGNKYSYRDFKLKAPGFINFITVEYPGRGGRMNEPLIKDINVIVDDVYEQVKDLIVSNDYAFFGHSMGGMVAYLLSVKIANNGIRQPLHLFITGTTGPSAVSRGEKKRFQMPQDEFFKEIKDFGGMPDEILGNNELLLYFEPILRSDFEASESYIHNNHPVLNVPITVITGTGEDMDKGDIELWQKESAYKVDFKRLPGKHFFIFNYVHEIIQIIARKLTTHKTVNYD
jgi:surfactin synthase thioesterase subunit